ncbi:hypothetical protein EV421DRAFT_1854954 [Armillaria borealis]|uniref:Uncharacterized protein n=1 Tax=Armillaria borealis TaxID=47425 RepID=A0AA39IV95_9AGAR|nr:hypothetical protein EV421DRAFT_1854954 [Armillaria borealis]
MFRLMLRNVDLLVLGAETPGYYTRVTLVNVGSILVIGFPFIALGTPALTGRGNRVVLFKAYGQCPSLLILHHAVDAVVVIGVLWERFPFSPCCVYHFKLPTNHITYCSLSTGLISRTVHVESHAEGYNVNRILAAIKANPTESIPGVKGHLIVRFFNEDTSKDCVVSGSGSPEGG